MVRKFFFLILFVLSTIPISAQSIGMEFAPNIIFPVGNKSEYFNIGYGGRVNAQLSFKEPSWLSPIMEINLDNIPLDISDNSNLTLLQLLGGLQGSMLFGERLSLYGYAAGGGYYGLLAGSASADDLYYSLQGGVGASFQIFNDVSISLGVEYNSFIGTFDALNIFMGIKTRLLGEGGGAVPLKKVTPLKPQNILQSGLIQISDIKLDTVFPVLLKYYDSHAIGKAVISNTGKDVLENLEVRAEPANYIDSAKLSARLDKLDPGQSESVELYVLFNENILNVSEGAKVITDITVNYKVQDQDGTDKETVTLEIYDRNSLRWDDDQKIAAFVTAKDGEIQRFSKNVVSMVQDKFINSINKELQLAMVQYSGMIEQGLSYIIDPSSAYKDFSENPMAIDFVQFPRQTLYVKAGDCDDLSTAFCTLLESIGIPTAFITIPGHIYMAFKLKPDIDEVKHSFVDTDNFIYRDDGSVWIPVETTALTQGFLKAWAAGARQWRKYDADGQAEFIRNEDAWENYKPVAFSVSSIELGNPSSTGVEKRFLQELNTFIGQEIAPREKTLRERIDSQPENPRLLNSLGVLYAHYGKYEEAIPQFTMALQIQDFIPAMINLGNISFLFSDFQKAKQYYKQVLEIENNNEKALLGLARTEFEMENFGSSRLAYLQLSSVSPKLADKFSYLGPESRDSASRAADSEALRNTVVWEDEE